VRSEMVGMMEKIACEEKEKGGGKRERVKGRIYIRNL